MLSLRVCGKLKSPVDGCKSIRIGRTRVAFLARKVARPVGGPTERRRASTPEEVEEVFIGQTSEAAEIRQFDREEDAAPTETPAKPSMRDVFGPGGFLERCMIGGYEHRRGQ